MPTCKFCGKELDWLGLASHEAMHKRAEQKKQREFKALTELITKNKKRSAEYTAGKIQEAGFSKKGIR